MKALVIAEHPEAARELAAGARTLADEVALVVFGEAPENVADAAYIVEVPGAPWPTMPTSPFSPSTTRSNPPSCWLSRPAM